MVLVLVQPGNVKASDILAAIAVGKVIQFEPGTFTFDAPLALTPSHSGAKILGAVSPTGAPLTNWVRGFTAPASAGKISFCH